MKTLRNFALAGFFGLLAAMAHARDDIVVALQLEPPHLDPTSAAAGSIDQILYSNVFEGLTRFGPDGAIMPGLAESWTVSEDGTQYIFKLQEGVQFHDGTEMDARDVKFSLDRAYDETSQNVQKALFAGIDEVLVIGPYLVKVTLDAPNGDFLFNLAWGDAVILAPESIGDIKQKPVGTGAFQFKEWIPNTQIELERNPNYWGEPAKLEKVVFRFINDPAAGVAAVMAEEVDAYPAFPSLENLQQFTADPRFQVLVGSTEGETILAINNLATPLDDVRVRRAIAHAIDRKAIIDAATFGLGAPIGTHFAPHHPDYVDLTEKSSYDPALSLQLLAEAGYEDGFATTLKLPPPDYARRSGALLAEQLGAVGISVDIVNLDWLQWSEEVFTGKDFGLTVISHPEPMDIGIYAQPDYYFQYDSEPFQAVLTARNAEPDVKKRAKWMEAAQRLIAEDYVNAYLFQLPSATVADARLRGLWENAPTQATDLTGVYWED